MRAFDTEAYLEACEPPAFTVGTRTYVGRVLSVFEQAAFDVRFAAAREGKLDAVATDALFRDYLTALFPPPEVPADPRSWRARWLWRLTHVLGTPPPPAPLNPVDVFFALPVLAQLQAFEDFAASRRRMPHPPGNAESDGATTSGDMRPRSVS